MRIAFIAMSAQELRDGLHLMVVELYSEQATLVRREHFKHLRFHGRGVGLRSSGSKPTAA